MRRDRILRRGRREEGPLQLGERVGLLEEDVVGVRAEHLLHRLARRTGGEDDGDVRRTEPERPQQADRVDLPEVRVEDDRPEPRGVAPHDGQGLASVARTVASPSPRPRDLDDT